LHDFKDGAGEPIPILFLNLELFAAGARQLVKLGAEIVLRHAPFGLDPFLTFDPVEGRVERTLFCNSLLRIFS
jgi:hypothetical protein